MTITFSSLGVRAELAEALREAGLAVPTPVQERTIPVALAGNDVIVQAQTGTGKTLAFLLPLLQHTPREIDHTRALILTPTRELAIQIAAEAHKLAAAAGSTVMSVYGGQDVIAQAHKLGSAPDMIVATPGRLLDHLRRGTIDLSRLSAFVLDEADQMLHMGFLPEVEDVIRQTPDSRQTMLFSATFPESVRVLAERYMRSPADIRVQGKRVTLDEIRQYVVETTDRARKETLHGLLAQQQPFLAVIFCRTKIRVKKLTEWLAAEGLNVDELHGDLTQAKREAVMERFREARLQFLVATDVAARGLDVEGVTHVYNYDVPHDSESYIHRIGRTGRAGQQGTAVTLAASKDEADLKEIERAIGVSLERRKAAVAGSGEGGGRSKTIGDEAGAARERRKAVAAEAKPGKRWQGRQAAGREPTGALSGKGGAGSGEAGGRGKPAVAGGAVGKAAARKLPAAPGKRGRSPVPAGERKTGEPSQRGNGGKPERGDASSGRAGGSGAGEARGWRSDAGGKRAAPDKPARWEQGRRGTRGSPGPAEGRWESGKPRGGGPSKGRFSKRRG